jgi:molecular chaperone GrpE
MKEQGSKRNMEDLQNIEKSQESPEQSNKSDEKDSDTLSSSRVTQELEKIKEKLNQTEAQYLRILADYQNLQKRSAQEKEDLYKYAAQKTIEVILPALDTYDYAKASLKPDSKAEKIIEDFNLVFEMLIKCMKDIGLETIEETGVPFDPVFHEPLHQIPTNELPDHTVMQVLKKGYILNKKVIRPALVSVSVKHDESPPEPIGSA